jgi:hypothetical protein
MARRFIGRTLTKNEPHVQSTSAKHCQAIYFDNHQRKNPRRLPGEGHN